MLSFGLSATNATTLYSCSLGGDFKVVDNVVSDGVTCSGVAVIPAGVTAIGVEAFRGATGLTSITLPAGMTSIGDSAFYLATSLNNVSIPSTVTSIGALAFYEARELTSIIIPSGVTSIESLTFYGAAKLSSVSFAAGSLLTQIKNQAFEKNYILESITIPAGVTHIGTRAFDEARSLNSVTFASDRTLLSIGYAAFLDAPITNLVIPSSVNSIGAYAFEGTSLTSIYFLSDSAPEMDPTESPFYEIDGTPKAYIRSGATGFDPIDFARAPEETVPGLRGHGLEVEVGIYSVSYNNQSATTAQLGGSSYYLKGSAISVIPTTPPAKSGHTFTGWYTATSGGTNVMDNSYAPASPFGDVTLFAKWTINNYTVSYNSNSGSAVTAGLFAYGGSVSEPASPTRSGYAFTGWTATDSGPTITFPYSPGVDTDVTLFAKWRKNLKATAPVKPTISGKATSTKKGSNKLTAKKGTWSGYPKPKITYRWYVCTKQVRTVTRTIPITCKAVAKQTKSTFAVTAKYKGKYLAVRVTGKSSGTTSTTWLSKSTAKVK
jgi:uncharacterized repeat protein (TIGR02543 family)